MYSQTTWVEQGDTIRPKSKQGEEPILYLSKDYTINFKNSAPKLIFLTETEHT